VATRRHRTLFLLASILCWACGDGPHAGQAGDQVRLNEVDCQADTVELVNVSDRPAELSRYAVTDEIQASDHRASGAGVLAPGSFALVHLVGFKLACGEETVSLLHDEKVVDSAPPQYMPNGGALGRVPDGIGPFLETLPTPGAANTSYPHPAATMFDPFASVSEIALEVEPAALRALEADGTVYVQARATITVGHEPVGPLTVGLRLKGRYGSFRTLDQKAAFKIDFDRHEPDQTLFGLRKLNLNNMVSDPASLSEWLAYSIFAAAGVPAPRTGYAHVTLNGADYGVYLALEAADDSAFRARHFASSSALYEGEYGDDLFPGSATELDLDYSDGSDHAPLIELVRAAESARPDTFYRTLAPHVDWQEALRAMATELLIGHSDGYVNWRNNYFLHADGEHRFSLLPWGVDGVFKKALPLFEGRGRLLRECLRDPTCTEHWLAALEHVSNVADRMLTHGLAERVNELADLNTQRFASDPRAEWPAASIKTHAHSALAFLRKRAEAIQAELACQRDPGADGDGDGQSCGLDCDDSDPGRHYGAIDSCGDGIDQNCDGFPDDRPECAECVEDASLPGILFCRVEKTYAEQEATCEAHGAKLIHIRSESEQQAVFDRASQLFPRMSFWLGEPSRHDFTFFAADNPRDLPGDECTQAHWASGEWVSNHCEAPWPAVCRKAGRTKAALHVPAAKAARQSGNAMCAQGQSPPVNSR
jgi:hypothetical protein